MYKTATAFFLCSQEKGVQRKNLSVGFFCLYIEQRLKRILPPVDTKANSDICQGLKQTMLCIYKTIYKRDKLSLIRARATEKLTRKKKETPKIRSGEERKAKQMAEAPSKIESMRKWVVEHKLRAVGMPRQFPHVFVLFARI